MRRDEQQAAACERGITTGCVGHCVGALGFTQSPGTLHEIPARRAGDVFICGEPGTLREVRQGTRGWMEEGSTFYCRVRREREVHYRCGDRFGESCA